MKLLYTILGFVIAFIAIPWAFKSIVDMIFWEWLELFKIPFSVALILVVAIAYFSTQYEKK